MNLAFTATSKCPKEGCRMLLELRTWPEKSARVHSETCSQHQRAPIASANESRTWLSFPTVDAAIGFVERKWPDFLPVTICSACGADDGEEPLPPAA
jgi:hypothetical protein